MITYPISLPTPKVMSHSETFANDMLLSTFEYGTSLEYKAMDTTKFNFSVILTYDELVSFNSFWDSLYNGIMPFKADWLILNDATTKDIRFTSPYTLKNLGALVFELSSDCEVL